MESKISHKPVVYKFHDGVYGRFNWAKEPRESIEELYAQRARELRSKYDYLVLHFSGGSDSANILETFIKNNIPLDEIFIRGPLSNVDKDVNNTKAENTFAEVFLNTLPIVEYVKKYFLPNIKVNLKDTSQFTIDYFKNKEWFSIDGFVPAFTPHIAWCTQLDMLDNSYIKLTESGKKVGHIVGLDKPQIYYENNQFLIRFLDKIMYLTPLGSTNQLTQAPMYHEPFYWGKSTAKMIIKQGHLIKNFVKSTNIDPHVLNSSGRPWHDFIANIIYKRTLPIYFNPDKAGTSLIQPWDRFFFAEGVLSTHGKNWLTNVMEVDSNLPKQWKNIEDQPLLNDANGIKGIYSKSYSLGN